MIDPRHMTVKEWCNAVALQLAAYGAMPLLNEEQWRLWAATVISLPQIANYVPPSPVGFKDWRDWAERFLQAVPI